MAPCSMPATMPIQKVKIPICCSGVRTQSKVPQYHGDGLAEVPEAAPICTSKLNEVSGVGNLMAAHKIKRYVRSGLEALKNTSVLQ